jgi:hypothetical protein
MTPEHKPCCDSCKPKIGDYCKNRDCNCHKTVSELVHQAFNHTPHSLDAVVEENVTKLFELTINAKLVPADIRQALTTYGEAVRKEERERLMELLTEAVGDYESKNPDIGWIKAVPLSFIHSTITNEVTPE